MTRGTRAQTERHSLISLKCQKMESEAARWPEIKREITERRESWKNEPKSL